MPRYSVAVVAKPEPKLEKSNFSNFARKYFRHTSQWCIFLEQEVREKCHAFETRELSCACRSCHVDHFVCRLRRSDECGRGHRHQQLCCLSPITKLQNEQGLDLIYLRWAIGGGDSLGSHWRYMASKWPLGGFFYFLARCELRTSGFFWVNMKRTFLASEWPLRPNLTSDLKSEAKI